jgi:hypothetical protein
MLNKMKNDGEASFSSYARRRYTLSSLPPELLLRDLPPAPRPNDYLQQLGHVVLDDDAPNQDRCYVLVDECERRWRDGEGIDHHVVSLPIGWHLTRARVSLSQVPKLVAEIRRRIRNLPETRRVEHKYNNEQL